MSTFIDDARAYRAQGATRKQLVSYIKLYGVDDDRAERLADRLDEELGLTEPTARVTSDSSQATGNGQRVPVPRIDARARPDNDAGVAARSRRSSVRRRPRIDRDELTAHTDEVVIDLTDRAATERSGATLRRAPSAQAAIEHAQRMIDDGMTRQMILEYLVYSGVSPAEAAHVATTIRPREAEIQIIQARPAPSRRRRRHDPRLSRALAQVLVGAVVGLIGYQAALNGWTGGISELWFAVAGGVIVLFGFANVINS